MRLEEIKFEDSEEGRIKAIQGCEGEEVIVNDEHKDWIHGILLRSAAPGAYRIKSKNPDKEERLSYHDLQTLLKVVPYNR